MRVATALGSDVIDVRDLLDGSLDARGLEKLFSKTGPRQVFHCAVGEDSVSLGNKAIANLLDQEAGFFTDSVPEILISVTESPRFDFPGNSFLYSSQFDFLSNAFNLDLNSGCTGFVDALIVAMAYGKKCLVVTSETYSKRIRFGDRTCSPIFSDGAAATFIQPAEWRKLEFATFKRSDSYSYITASHDHKLSMIGSKVFDFVVQDVAPLLRRVAEKTLPNIIFVHQASAVVLDFLDKTLKQSNLKLPRNLETLGNTCSSTIPFLLSDFLSVDDFEMSDKVMFVGFGVGLTCSILVMERV